MFKQTFYVYQLKVWNKCFQIMIVDYKLTYPSGTATAYLINGFHTPEGAELAKYASWTLLACHCKKISMCLLIISSPISGSKFGRWASTSHLVSFGPSSSGSIQLGTTADSAPSQHSALKLTKTSQYHYILVLNSNSAKLPKRVAPNLC